MMTPIACAHLARSRENVYSFRCLLPPPVCRPRSDDAGGSSARIERASAVYEPLFSRYVVAARSYQQQYSHIYNRRLCQMRDLVKAASRKRWTDSASATRRTGMLPRCLLYAEERCPRLSQIIVVSCVFFLLPASRVLQRRSGVSAPRSLICGQVPRRSGSSSAAFTKTSR